MNFWRRRKIKGFFYSENLIEINGVHSKVTINGGVSGGKVVLNGYKRRNGGYNSKSYTIQS